MTPQAFIVSSTLALCHCQAHHNQRTTTKPPLFTLLHKRFLLVGGSQQILILTVAGRIPHNPALDADRAPFVTLSPNVVLCMTTPMGSDDAKVIWHKVEGTEIRLGLMFSRES